MRATEFIREDAVKDLEKDLKNPLGYDAIDHMMKAIAKKYNMTPKELHDKFVDKHGEIPDDWISESAAWQKSSGKNKNGGLNKKGVASYRREHPGSHLQTAVTKKPSELKKGSKASKRRKSFCARMKGMKKSRTSAKTAHDPNSRINKSLRKWHCESIEEMANMIALGEHMIAEMKQGVTEASAASIRGAIAISKKESGKYTKDGKRKKK